MFWTITEALSCTINSSGSVKCVNIAYTVNEKTERHICLALPICMYLICTVIAILKQDRGTNEV